MHILNSLPQFHILKDDLLDGHCIQMEGCVTSQTEELISELSSDYEFTVIAAADEAEASSVLNNYSAFDPNVFMYPALDPFFHKADIQGSFITDQRTCVIKNITMGQSCTVVTTYDAFRERLDPVSKIMKETLTIRPGDTLDEEEFAEKLVEMGYEHETQVSGRGEFSIRGNIIDVFPYAYQAPFRIDLFGDEVDTIRIFDTESQRSADRVEEMMIFPGADPDPADDPEEAAASGYSTFKDYFKDKKVLFVLMEPVRAYKIILGMNPLDSARESDMEEIPDDEENHIRTEELTQTLASLTEGASLVFSSLGESASYIDSYRVMRINARSIPSYNGRFTELTDDLKKYRKNGYRVILECAGRTRAENMIRNLADNGVTIGEIAGDPSRRIKASDIQVITGSARAGFEYPDSRIAFITEVDIFGVRKSRKKRRKYSGDPIKEFTDLSVGDYVVHEQHGVGIYKGMERITVDGVQKDYMKIGYAGKSSLYVLATQFDKIQKYAGGDATAPKLNKLGGKEWANTKARVRTAVQDIAGDLVQLYAERQMRTGFRYSPDTVWQREFEDSFEYEETGDQLNAIEDVKKDMESGRIMDRLICGDVGFGKTEVAIRAAFKAVQDGRQVAFLTPTTILAQQHFNTLSRRLENYPVSISMLSRFATAKEQAEIVKGLASGRVDIVVGTHRLLSKDVKFKELGLLIVDEEQRFGVTHKEKIKQMRKNIDVITLSATPIPRTLHMSLTGIRDMSILTEPPVDRIPIQTYVMEYSEAAVQEAISREVSRGGQVYYVYNRTNNIDMVAARIQELVPNANIAYAHGRMGSKELEDIMFDFINGQIDVLVSTTIIETGLDIPNVNTIIIHDADNFGLSQLYQLRGRVGRSNRTAYAFLMYKKDKLIREVAEKRLKAIREFSDLGSGIRIAMRDLEIRGAGNVLGAEQSGHMEAVGYELYCKMLNQAVAVMKGERLEEDFETTIDLDIDGFIPASYITNEFEKLNMYKKISAISDTEELEDVQSELEDRFGEVPKATLNLLQVAYIKSMAHSRFITEITDNRKNAALSESPASLRNSKKAGRIFKISMLSNAPIDTYKMLDIIRERKGELRFVPDKDPYFVYSPESSVEHLDEIKETLLEFFGILDKLIEK